MESSYGRILSVDNESSFREEVNQYLEDSGFTTFEASSNKEALTLFKEKKPDLVLSSIQMINENGLALLESLHHEYPDIPVIVMSHPDKVDQLLEALHLGAWDYVIKPVKNLAVLEHAVCRALERGRLIHENKRYRRELEEKNIQLNRSLLQLKEDQEAGKSVQQQLLPAKDLQFGKYRFAYDVLPSLYLSGDAVNYFEITDILIGFYIVDVSGHGASSAFVTILIRNLIEQLLLHYRLGDNDYIIHPHQVLKRISDVVLKLKLGKYLTMVFGIINQETDCLQYSIGGHYPSPIVLKEERAEFLEGRGFALGIFEKAHFTTQEYRLTPGVELCFFSDGIFEIIGGDSFSEKEKKLLAFTIEAKGEIPSFLKKTKMEQDDNFPDDVAILFIKRI